MVPILWKGSRYWGTKAHKKASVAAYTSFKDAVLPHLSNPQFKEVLGMARPQFYAMTMVEQMRLKQDVGLF